MAIDPKMLDRFFSQQLKEWSFFAKNNALLSSVECKQLNVAGDRLIVQFNPNRTTSATAKIDPQSIQKRPCFLCPKNRQGEQRSLTLNKNFYAMVNPLPIFDRHFTVVHNDHCSQEISSYLEDFLEITKMASPDYLTIFNGARAGASAPDHMHLQLMPNASLPVVEKISGETNFGLIKIYGTSYIFLREGQAGQLASKIRALLSGMANICSDGPDFLNLIARFSNSAWEVILIPRSKHRPQCYFESGDRQLLVSPGYVELSGVFVTVRSEDFSKIDGTIAANIISEVTYNEDQVQRLLMSLNS